MVLLFRPWDTGKQSGYSKFSIIFPSRRFTPTFVQNLLSKYSPRERKMTLDNFIVVSVQIKRLTDSFRTRDTAMNGSASLQYEDFVGLALGSHK